VIQREIQIILDPVEARGRDLSYEASDNRLNVDLSLSLGFGEE
jgi:hypothetical protein